MVQFVGADGNIGIEGDNIRIRISDVHTQTPGGWQFVMPYPAFKVWTDRAIAICKEVEMQRARCFIASLPPGRLPRKKPATPR